MSAEELLKMTEKVSSAVMDTQAIRDKIFQEFAVAPSSEHRGSLLQMFKATMDVAESWHAAHDSAETLAAFRKARVDDYTQLLVNESCVDGNVSPEMLMFVTNREIAAGRLPVDDPIRQIAVKAAGSPHPSHAEMVEKAEAKRRGDAVIQSLLDELKAVKTFDIVDMRAKIEKAWDAATTSEQHGTVLGIFKATMDQVERTLESRSDQPELLENFRKARVQDYKIFIVQESLVGLHSPGGGQISIEMLMAVTNREIAAGRMTEDHSMRKLAVEGAAAPHFSHAEMLANDAKVREQAEQSVAPPAGVTTSGSPKAHAFGTVLGRKLKGLFQK